MIRSLNIEVDQLKRKIKSKDGEIERLNQYIGKLEKMNNKITSQKTKS